MSDGTGSPGGDGMRPEKRHIASQSQLHDLWFGAQKRSWASLAIVPADEGVSAEAVASAFADVGRIHSSRPVRLLNSGALSTIAPSAYIAEMKAQVASRSVVIAALDPVLSSPASLAAARAADAVLLCVLLGETDSDSARRTVELIGRDRVLGCVVLRRA